nr:MAG TPA: hypothetical protein [Caudoviricetes sp.]
MSSISTKTLLIMPSFLFISLLTYGAEVPTICASCACVTPSSRYFTFTSISRLFLIS